MHKYFEQTIQLDEGWMSITQLLLWLFTDEFDNRTDKFEKVIQ